MYEYRTFRSQTHPQAANYAKSNLPTVKLINKFAPTTKADPLIAVIYRTNRFQTGVFSAAVLTELLQPFELKHRLLAVPLAPAEAQGRARQDEPAGPPVGQVVTLFVVQPANQLAVPPHQRLHRGGGEALPATHAKNRG